MSLATEKLALMQKLGVPYSNLEIDNAAANERAQAQTVANDLEQNGVKVDRDSEIIALIAYLQRLGRDQGVVVAAAPVATPAPAVPAPAAPAPVAPIPAPPAGTGGASTGVH